MFSQYLSLDAVDVTLKNAEICESVLSGGGESADGCLLLGCSIFLSPCHSTENLLHFSLCRGGGDQHSIWTAGGNPFTVLNRVP